MSENVGKVDQAIRLILGSVLIGSLTFNVIPAPPTIVGVIGIYLVMSGYSGTGMIYSLLNLNTRQGETDSLIPEDLLTRSIYNFATPRSIYLKQVGFS